MGGSRPPSFRDVMQEHSLPIPARRYLAIIAVAALILSLIELTEVVSLPFEGVMGGAISSSFLSANSIVSVISQGGYTSLFLLMTLESASLPIPSEVILPYAGYLVYQGTMNFALAVAVGTLALVSGALIDFFLALKLGKPFVDRLLARFGVKPQAIDSAERWMNSRGTWSVLIARFIPGLRSIISFPAGILGMNLKPFFLMTLVGSFVWSTVLIYLGYSAGRLWRTAFASSSVTVVSIISVLVAALSVSYIVYYAYATSFRVRSHAR